ncbi:FtsX-like permease family protein [Amycolatopsis taiwanensis]|uniref:FtsX-like permease family protein n=1 Tax=Amycolatopsis taiwanensis TaxID=342230 RepID=UPI00069381F5|nr:FtsX-like permease family protein [Amycolatopsis taiwanensis]
MASGSPVPTRRGAPSGWLTDIALGVRLAVGGGRTLRSSLLRLTLTTVGIGLCTAMLLLLATAATALSHRVDRETARTPQNSTAAAAPLYENQQSMVYDGSEIKITYLEPLTSDAPVPPGLQGIPAPGDMVVSPALAARLSTDADLRARFSQRVAGTIAPDGLAGPKDLRAYAGATGLRSSGSGTGVSGFGGQANAAGLPALVTFFGALAVLVLVIPLLVFVASASRIAGAERERRLSALRLAGASARQVRRIGAAESLVGAATGGLLGLVAFLVARPFAAGVDLAGITVFPGDFVPAWPLVVAVFVLLPVLTVGSAWLGMRRVVVEPLGVVRVAKTARRRGWWRLLLVALGLLLLLSVKVFGTSGASEQLPFVLVGSALLMIGVPTAVPWLTELAVSRLRGGSSAWQLAIRRLQLDSGTPSRVIAGIVVVLTGVITLQVLLGSAQADQVHQREESSTTVYLQAADGPDVAARVRAQQGVRAANLEYRGGLGNGPSEWYPLVVAPCELLEREYGLPDCTDGDTFASGQVRPGQTYDFVSSEGVSAGQARFTVPATARSPGDSRRALDNVLITPGAAGSVDLSRLQASLDVQFDTADPAALQGLFVALAPLQWRATVFAAQLTTVDGTLSALYGLLYAGVLLSISLAGVSLLVMTAGQLVERRRPLAALRAAGIPHGVLQRSLLWQNAVPMVVGVVTAVAGGLGISWLLLRLIDDSMPWQVNGTFVAFVAVAALVLVLVVTAAALPILKSVTRLDALRAE